jgi:hypothetical protein
MDMNSMNLSDSITEKVSLEEANKRLDYPRRKSGEHIRIVVVLD